MSRCSSARSMWQANWQKFPLEGVQVLAGQAQMHKNKRPRAASRNRTECRAQMLTAIRSSGATSLVQFRRRFFLLASNRRRSRTAAGPVALRHRPLARSDPEADRLLGCVRRFLLLTANRILCSTDEVVRCPCFRAKHQVFENMRSIPSTQLRLTRRSSVYSSLLPCLLRKMISLSRRSTGFQGILRRLMTCERAQ